MPDTVDFAGVTARLRSAAALLKANRDQLSQLDSAVGDGDHGLSMGRVADAVVSTIEAHTAGDLAALLAEMGWAIMGTDGGSTSPLFGSFIMGLGDGVTGPGPWDARALATAFEAGQAKLRQQTKAAPGGKTLVDALVPAVAALRTAADDGASVPEALRAAAVAASAGAESTRAQRALFGRARNLGDRTIGHQDPGATSMALFFEGLAAP